MKWWWWWVEHQTVDFCSGPDLRVMGWSPMLGSTRSVEPAWNSLSPFPFSPPRLHALSTIKKKIVNLKNKTVRYLTGEKKGVYSEIAENCISRHTS